MSDATRVFKVKGQVEVFTCEHVSAGRKNQRRDVVCGYALWCSVCGDLDVEGSDEYSSLKTTQDFGDAARQGAEHLEKVHNITVALEPS